ncbi:MAG: triose-phosphate isomerase [Patescibacteria group bacterium]|jgi:triosephosphate isomerase|nr:triose-phosphate isomerase [Patescibacteria group bacterium]
MKTIIANLKMNPTSEKEADEIFNFYQEEIQKFNRVNLIVAPPYIYLKLAKEKGLEVAAQNCFYEKSGAYTGEISSLMLKDLGVGYVILGHSERRSLGENNELIAKKTKAVLENKLMPILCVGETKEELKIRENIIKEQLKSVFSLAASDRIIIAYEPRWAIGTGEFCNPQTASEIHQFIKDFIKDEFGINNILVLYGGSVDGQNIEIFLNQSNIDGALVGGASLNKEEFAKILEIANSK